jgi:hypothetical protein
MYNSGETRPCAGRKDKPGNNKQSNVLSPTPEITSLTFPGRVFSNTLVHYRKALRHFPVLYETVILVFRLLLPSHKNDIIEEEKREKCTE